MKNPRIILIDMERLSRVSRTGTETHYEARQDGFGISLIVSLLFTIVIHNGILNNRLRYFNTRRFVVVSKADYSKDIESRY
jgi:hypothetical protein